LRNFQNLVSKFSMLVRRSADSRVKFGDLTHRVFFDYSLFIFSEFKALFVSSQCWSGDQRITVSSLETSVLRTYHYSSKRLGAC